MAIPGFLAINAHFQEKRERAGRTARVKNEEERI